MARYGINSRILSSSFLENMLKFKSFNAYICLEEEAKKNHDFRQQKRLKRIKKNIFKEELDYLDSLNKRERQTKISELIPTTYPSISHLPIRALISPINTKVINKKLQSFSYNKPILDLDAKLKKLGYPATFDGESFSVKQLDDLRRAIVWLNWFWNDIANNSIRPKKEIFSSEIMKNLTFLKTNDEILKYIKKITKKGKKIEVENLFKKIDLNNTSPAALKSFISALSENTYIIMLMLKNKHKFKKKFNATFSTYEYLLEDMPVKEKNIFRNLPIFYLNSFDGYTTQYDNYFYKNGLSRMWQLLVFKNEFKGFFSNLTKTREILKILKESSEKL